MSASSASASMLATTQRRREREHRSGPHLMGITSQQGRRMLGHPQRPNTCSNATLSVSLRVFFGMRLVFKFVDFESNMLSSLMWVDVAQSIKGMNRTSKRRRPSHLNCSRRLYLGSSTCCPPPAGGGPARLCNNVTILYLLRTRPVQMCIRKNDSPR